MCLGPSAMYLCPNFSSFPPKQPSLLSFWKLRACLLCSLRSDESIIPPLLPWFFNLSSKLLLLNHLCVDSSWPMVFIWRIKIWHIPLCFILALLTGVSHCSNTKFNVLSSRHLLNSLGMEEAVMFYIFHSSRKCLPNNEHKPMHRNVLPLLLSVASHQDAPCFTNASSA